MPVVFADKCKDVDLEIMSFWQEYSRYVIGKLLLLFV